MISIIDNVPDNLSATEQSILSSSVASKTTLPPDNMSARSATEIVERMKELAQNLGAAFGRLQNEMVTPVLQRVIYILKKQGRVKIPKINGREVKITSSSPLAQAQFHCQSKRKTGSGEGRYRYR